LDSLKVFEEKIAYAIEKIKSLKEEKAALERRIVELETIIKQKDAEIENLNEDKFKIKGQIEDLVRELDNIQIQ
jgi:chromosome segregation ATPase